MSSESRFRAKYGFAAEMNFADYVRSIVEKTATSNKVFGFKLMGWYLNDFLARLRQSGAFGDGEKLDIEVLSKAFPRLRFVQITRREKLRQAISKARAIQTGLWKVQEGKTEIAQPWFDRALIARCLKEGEEQENIWHAFFTRIGLQPFPVEYEELCQNYETTIRAVLDFLEIVLPRELKINRPVTIRQSDTLSAEWEQRYRASDSLCEPDGPGDRH